MDGWTDGSMDRAEALSNFFQCSLLMLQVSFHSFQKFFFFFFFFFLFSKLENGSYIYHFQKTSLQQYDMLHQITFSFASDKKKHGDMISQ